MLACLLWMQDATGRSVEGFVTRIFVIEMVSYVHIVSGVVIFLGYVNDLLLKRLSHLPDVFPTSCLFFCGWISVLVIVFILNLERNSLIA